MRLKYQLFITLLLASGVLIALMFAVNSWSFNRGFLSYINSTQHEKVIPIVNTLEAEFATQGNWHWLTDDKRVWQRLIGREFKSANPSARRSKPPRRDTGETNSEQSGPKPPKSGQPSSGQPNSARSEKRRPPRKPASGRPPQGVPELILADSNKVSLIGRIRPQDTIKWSPITVHSNTVGFLGVVQLHRLPGGMDQVFSDQQKRSFGYAALAMILLSALLAIVLASRIVKPILSIGAAVTEITQGHFKHRISMRRRDEFGDLSQNINQLALTLDKSLESRQRWIAEISHELRTPVAILQGEIESMQDGITEPDQSAIASLHAETIRLSRLIDDLHDMTLSDIGALNYSMRTLDICELIEERVAAGQAKAREKSLTVETRYAQSSIVVSADEHRLGQLFDNLMQNSIRYTDQQGEIHINVELEDDDVIVQWSDSTPGVTDEQLPKLFESLFRADESRNRAYGGSGLGLAIARKIVEAHGGFIEAAHSEMGGLSLHIRFPRSYRRQS